VPDLQVSVSMLCLWESSKVYKKIELQWLQERVELRCRYEGLVGVSFGQHNTNILLWRSKRCDT